NKKIYFHDINTNQESDDIIFGEKDDVNLKDATLTVTEDQNFLIINATQDTCFSLFVKKLNSPSSPAICLTNDSHDSTFFLTSDGDNLYLSTNYQSSVYQVVKVNINRPKPSAWTRVLPKQDNGETYSAGGKSLFSYNTTNNGQVVNQYTFDGKFVRQISTPDTRIASVLKGNTLQPRLYFKAEKLFKPASINVFNSETGECDTFIAPESPMNPITIESKQVEYLSEGNSRLTMRIYFKKGIELNKDNPTILYARNYPRMMTLGIDFYFSFWLDMGGVLAVPELINRNQSPTLMAATNYLIAAADFLVKEKYTSTSRLAIMNPKDASTGQIVGLAITQRPDLANAVIIREGTLDKHYDIKAINQDPYYKEFIAQNMTAEDIITMKDTSPIQQLKNDISYPSMLIIPPAYESQILSPQSYKFAATLQENMTNQNPVLLFGLLTIKKLDQLRETVYDIVEYNAIFSFILDSMGLSYENRQYKAQTE
ncbi:MAG: prolyl oligopeptidase family serine peptidase, partial [Cellvibrionales bacterium]|nr:prolyl oligopeptidase family serine peptidase [Cellvibrionales bacterium]